MSAWSRDAAQRYAVREQRFTLQKEPNRFNAFAGAAEAAKRVGDTAKARTYCEKLVAIAGDGEPTRTALAAARQLLATR